MRKYFLLALVLGLLGLTLPTSAQESNVIVNGLNNPRGLYYDENGVLWIAEAGTGGDLIGQGSLRADQIRRHVADRQGACRGKPKPRPCWAGCPARRISTT